MAITTISSRHFNQGAKWAAKNGPVFITDQGPPAHVPMSFEDYQPLTKQRRNIANAGAIEGGASRIIYCVDDSDQFSLRSVAAALQIHSICKPLSSSAVGF